MNSYKKLCTEFYCIDKPDAPAEILAFYMRYAREARGPILEPMCGSGRYLLPMLQHGLSIEGVDASADMLRACKEIGGKSGLEPVLYEQFLDQLDLPGRYSLVMIPAASFCLVTEPAQVRESLRRLYDLMLPGAKFVLDVRLFAPRPQKSDSWGGRWIDRPDGTKIVISWTSRYEPGERVLLSLNRYELIKNSRLMETEWEEFKLRFYEPEEFRALLESAGFESIQSFTMQGEKAAPDYAGDSSLVFECLRHS